MKNCKFIISLGLFLTLFCTNGFAVQVNSLYQARLSVADHSDTARQAAFSTGLQQVLVKVSGNAAVVTLPQIHTALDGASNYVQSYGYDDQDLTIKFDRSGVLQILHGAHQPVWGDNRPLILIWLTVADKSGQYNFVTNGSILLQNLQNVADSRGLPVLLPIFDMQDLMSLSVGDVSGENIQALQKASQRYKADTILSGSLVQDGNNGWQSSWLFLDGASSVKWQITGDSATQVVTKAINNVGNELAAQHAVVSDGKLSKEFTVMVTGVNGLSGYAQVVKYLQNLDGVSKVALVGVTPGAVKLTVVCDGGNAGLSRAVALDRKLVSEVLPATTNAPTDIDAVYRWGV